MNGPGDGRRTEPQFVSEPIEPIGARRDAAAMVRGEPGLPDGFAWRGAEFRIAEVISRAKGLQEDMGEIYVRRHTFDLRMDDGAIWEVYFLRQAPKGVRRGAKPARWFLKTRTPA